jgi:hypothetical protein
MGSADSFGSSYTSSLATDALGAADAVVVAEAVGVVDATGLGVVGPEPPPHAQISARHTFAKSLIGATYQIF